MMYMLCKMAKSFLFLYIFYKLCLYLLLKNKENRENQLDATSPLYDALTAVTCHVGAFGSLFQIFYQLELTTQLIGVTVFCNKALYTKHTTARVLYTFCIYIISLSPSFLYLLYAYIFPQNTHASVKIYFILHCM